jgi:deazaflavin-dependent oxidoreductase (nitroreductase family)
MTVPGGISPYAEANVVFRAMRRMAGWRPVSWLYARILSPIDRAVSRISGRRMTFVRLVSGLPVLLLTTTGARTGAKRTQPLLYLREGDDLVVIGSNWGQAHNPAWYYNLRANPYAEVALSGVIALHGQMSDVQSPVNFAINRTFSPWRVGLDRDRYGDDNLIGGRCQLLGGHTGRTPFGAPDSVSPGPAVRYLAPGAGALARATSSASGRWESAADGDGSDASTAATGPSCQCGNALRGRRLSTGHPGEEGRVVARVFGQSGRWPGRDAGGPDGCAAAQRHLGPGRGRVAFEAAFEEVGDPGRVPQNPGGHADAGREGDDDGPDQPGPVGRVGDAPQPDPGEHHRQEGERDDIAGTVVRGRRRGWVDAHVGGLLCLRRRDGRFCWLRAYLVRVDFWVGMSLAPSI